MENKKLFGLLCYLHRQMSRENNALFADYGITPVQMQTLVFVAVHTGRGENVCQRDIEKYVNLRASSVSTLINILESNGFVSRVTAEDARVKYVTLTKKGVAVCNKNKALMENCDAVIQSALSDEEQKTFKNLLLKIIDRIENVGKEKKADDKNFA